MSGMLAQERSNELESPLGGKTVSITATVGRK